MKEINKLADTKNKYDDIINLPHHISLKHPRMSIENRAAQFSPFAALTGYDEAIRETARVTDEKIEIDEGLKESLNRKLQIIESIIKTKPKVRFTYFVKDLKKKGGKYVDVMGSVKKIDNIEGKIILTDKKVIPINEIIKIELDKKYKLE